MFGVIPKTFWETKAPPDERNRIRMAMRCLLVRGARTMLIDAGSGDKMTEKQADIYRLERDVNLSHSLSAAGVSADAIDLVLATHLHFDHAGGFTARGADGSVRPRFPRAQYVIRRGEWEDAMQSQRADEGQLLSGELRAACRPQRAAARRCGRDDHAGRSRAAHGRPHDAPSDGADRIGRQDSGVRRGPAADGRASS